MVAVLAEHGRPSVRERGALVIGDLRARLETGDDRTVVGSWSAAFHLAALTLLLAGVAGELLRSTTAPSRRWRVAGAACDRAVRVGRTLPAANSPALS